jgi:hypothetical protein
MTEITWQTKSGKAATVTVELARRIRHLGTNEWTGEAIERDEGYKITTTAHVEGMGEIGRTLYRSCPLDGYTGRVGKLAVPADKMPKIEAAIEACKARPEWQEQVARRAAKDAEMREYEDHYRRVERMSREGY